MIRKPATILLVLSLAVLALALVPAAGLAAKGGNGGGGGKPGGGGGGGGGGSRLSLVMVADADGDGVVSHGDTVTFNVSTSADRPYVSVKCYQAGTLVYAASAGFYADYPGIANFAPGTTTWTSGGADCTAQAVHDH